MLLHEKYNRLAVNANFWITGLLMLLTLTCLGQKGTYLIASGQFDLDKIKTMKSMQEHIQFVSMEHESDVVKQLQANGFSLMSKGVISAAGITNERLRCYVAQRGNNIVIVFRGTKSVGNLGQTIINTVLTDANIEQVKPSFITSNSVAPVSSYRNSNVHKGFDEAYKRLRRDIHNAIQEAPGSSNIFIFGHSLGGALASLCALDIAVNQNRRFASITHIVSGSPRVGDETFRAYFERAVKNNLRLVINSDPVPSVPNFIGVRAANKYHHAGNLLVLGKQDAAIVFDNIDVNPNIRHFPNHNNELYLEVVDKFLKKAINTPSVYGRGSRIIEDIANKERALANRRF
ncbi:lipase family protein [Belliella sp. R4-6]|uniref:Lipase family protein n=1 Tax=Belliella alkalica TaxID=1730871 RepID=A0ABS9V7P3_9BACT|nr:lipase family protein [Belliella alkalica]MCH7412439.1 lipase family protein [Belliella alkalica]